ncbi:signal peptidase I [Magnetococcus sp. PR-3]|uniref:signal peptidase I n=1 Tax=Magnetococcus sp. PR-3 TaxID=3120355 RepID=UPI002FCE1DCB
MLKRQTKHLWHGVLFMLAGLFMLGGYVAVSLDGAVVVEPFHFWTAVAVVMILGGGFMMLRGKSWFEKESIALEYYDAIVVALGFALLIRTFVVEPFKIPSGSMIPTLLVGDYLFVNKLAYGYRLPYTQKRILMGDGPERGDVAVFKFPMEPSKDYIKRIVALPGDRVSYENKRLYINGKPLDYKMTGEYSYLNEYERRINTLGLKENNGERSYRVLIQPNVPAAFPMEHVVPEGHYFAMGDNRDNSNDSRYWGYVPAFRLVGRATRLFWSWDHVEGRVRFDRVGDPIR